MHPRMSGEIDSRARQLFAGRPGLLHHVRELRPGLPQQRNSSSLRSASRGGADDQRS